MVNEIKEINYSDKLNLNRVGQINIDDDMEIMEVDPSKLINSRRFDIMAKYIYAKFYDEKLDSSWGIRIYEDHIWNFNNYDEDDGSDKKGIATFIKSYNFILESMGKNGFDENISLLPVTKDYVPIDGAHRIAAALLHNQRVKVVQVNHNNPNYNYEFFKRKGLQTKWSDAITYEYCKLKNKTFIINLFTDIHEEAEDVRRAIEGNGSIYYEKEIELNANSIVNLSIHIKERCWIENLIRITETCNSSERRTMKVFVFEPKNNTSKLKIKQKLLGTRRDFSFYISKNHSNTVSFAQMLFNANSIYNIKNAIARCFRSFENVKSQYNKFLKDNNIDKDCICVISDSVLAAYGLKDSETIEFIYNGREFTKEELIEFPGVSNYKGEIPVAIASIDDIIFNPENHFYYEGLKFANLRVVKSIKRQQFTIKNNKDIQLINSVLDSKFKTIDKELLLYNFKKKLKILKLKISAIKNKYRTSRRIK